jgi:hypothetical protein
VFDFTSASLIVRLRTAFDDKYITADDIRIERVGDLPQTGNAESLVAETEAADRLPPAVVGGSLRPEAANPVEAPSTSDRTATTYWRDDQDDVITMLAEDRSRKEPRGEAAITPQGRPEQEELFDLALSEWN